MIEKGAVTELKHQREEGFVSRLFLVPKKDGQMRPVINLKPLNRFLVYHHFKMEGIQVVRDILRLNKWMTRIDLKDAYFSIPIHQSHQKYLRFKWEKKMYQFTCLPFGLASAPRLFTKVLRPVVGYLRGIGIRCVIYLDDLLLLDQNKERLREHTAIALAVLEALGFLVNYPKSSVTPDQVITFLGFVIDSRSKTLSLPQEKVAALKQQVRAMSKKKLVSALALAQLIGKMSAALLAVSPAPLHYRSLQHLEHKALRKRCYDTLISISSKAQNLSRWNGRMAKDPDPNLIIETDASKRDWGASCQGVMTGGCWSKEEANLHINVLEMMAASFAIQAFTKHLRGVRILLRTDNTSVVAHLNHMGGTRSPRLIALVKELWSWCLHRKTTVIAQHLPGLKNVTADFLSRHISDKTDWMLDPSIFRCIDSLMGPLQVDLFATRFTKQLPRFYSWRPDPEAEETDAFMQDWSNLLGFAHPPWCLISRVLGKIQLEKATVVLITPLWQTQAWFPTLIEMIVDFPIILPRQEILAPSPNCMEMVRSHPPQLVVWKVSSRDSDQKKFQRKLLNSSLAHGEIRPTPIMIHPGDPGTCTVEHTGYVPFRQLYPMY